MQEIHLMFNQSKIKMKTKRTTKPLTTDCYGNSFFNMTIDQLIEIKNSMQTERNQYSFWNEGVRFQRKHTATMELLSNLINS